MPRAERLCVYCGSADATTADHIPPKALYSQPLPSGLITVPSCRHCNEAGSKDDEYLRTVLALKEGAGDHPDAKFAAKAALRSFSKPRKAGFARSILTTVRTVQVRTPTGLHLGRSLAYEVDFQRLSRVVARITMGLYWHHRRRRLPEGYYVDTLFEDGLLGLSAVDRRSLASSILAPLYATSAHSTPRDVLVYWFGIDQAHDPVSAWLYQFYGDVKCLTLVVPMVTKAGF